MSSLSEIAYLSNLVITSSSANAAVKAGVTVNEVEVGALTKYSVECPAKVTYSPAIKGLGGELKDTDVAPKEATAPTLLVILSDRLIF